MSRISFQLEAETGNAVGAFLKLVEAQRKGEVGMERLVKRSKELENAGAAAGNAMRTGLGNLANLAVAGLAGGGLTAFAANAVQNFEQMRVKTLELNDDMRGLLSVGNNLDNIESVRNQVLKMSSAWGISRKEIAAAMFDLQSGTANLDAATRNQLLDSSLRFTKLAGGELPVNMKALIKTFQIYREELGSVDVAAAKVFMTGELGYMTFAEMAQLLPDVLPPAKAMGVHFDEVAGALITATQYGGKSEKTFTGVRNVILRMNNAEQEGIQLTGTFADKLEQLSKVDPETLKRIFGDEAIAVIATLAERVAEVRRNIEQMKQTSSGVVTERMNKRLTDPVTAYADTTKAVDQQIENSRSTTGYVSAFGYNDLQYKFLKAGIAASYSDTEKGFGIDAVQEKIQLGNLLLKERLGVPGDYSKLDYFIRTGAREYVAQQREAKNNLEADRIEIGFLKKGAGGISLPGTNNSFLNQAVTHGDNESAGSLERLDLGSSDMARYTRLRLSNAVKNQGEYISLVANEQLESRRVSNPNSFMYGSLGGVVPPGEDRAFERPSEMALALTRAAADIQAASQAFVQATDVHAEAAELQRDAARTRRDHLNHSE